MDALTIFGLLSVSAMLLFYALEPRGPHYVLAFAAACALSGIYGVLQGVWPFGLVETIWVAVAGRAVPDYAFAPSGLRIPSA